MTYSFIRETLEPTGEYQEGMRIRWGTKGFSLNVVSDGAHVPACFGYPPSAYNQQIYTEFASIIRKSNVPQSAVDALRQEALNTGLFRPAGKGTDLSCQTHLPLDESQLDALSDWLALVIDKIPDSVDGHQHPQVRDNAGRPEREAAELQDRGRLVAYKATQEKESGNSKGDHRGRRPPGSAV